MSATWRRAVYFLSSSMYTPENSSFPSVFFLYDVREQLFAEVNFAQKAAEQYPCL